MAIKFPIERLTLHVEYRAHGQWAIVNHPESADRWEHEYVCFSGYFGAFDPNTFAKAPDAFDALASALEYFNDRQRRYKTRVPKWVKMAESLLVQ